MIPILTKEQRLKIREKRLAADKRHSNGDPYHYILYRSGINENESQSHIGHTQRIIDLENAIEEIETNAQSDRMVADQEAVDSILAANNFVPMDEKKIKDA